MTIDSGSQEHLDRPLPEAVRQRVVEAAAELIGALPAEEVPMALRRFARFERRKRAKLAGRPIATAVERDDVFRERLSVALCEAEPELAAGLREGTVPAAADPVHVAMLAYLIRPPGWPRLVEVAREELERDAGAAEEQAAGRQIEVLRAEIAELRAAKTAEIEAVRAELRAAKTEISQLRHKLHDERGKARQARDQAAESAAVADREQAAAREATAAADKELRRLRGRLAQAETAVETMRRAGRAGRNVDDVRLRMLLDTLVDAAQGIRRELALPSMIDRPADAVGAVQPSTEPHRALPGRALSDDDPRLLDQLLTLPQVHVIIDGYNVTKTGYGDLPLADQRSRLLKGLGGLTARTKAEITCVFDGAELDAPVAIAAPRGVRVLFSRPGQIADELIRELVQAEPPGRAVVVVSSDREVADHARRSGARPAPSSLLLRRLGRG